MKEFNPYESGYPMLILNKPPQFIKDQTQVIYPFFEGFKPGELILNQNPFYVPAIHNGSLFGHYFINWYMDSIYGYLLPKMEEKLRNEYRKFIEENRFRGIKPHSDFRPLSIQWSQCTKSHGNNIKYDSRRLFDDMGK